MLFRLIRAEKDLKLQVVIPPCRERGRGLYSQLEAFEAPGGVIYIVSLTKGTVSLACMLGGQWLERRYKDLLLLHVYPPAATVDSGRGEFSHILLL